MATNLPSFLQAREVEQQERDKQAAASKIEQLKERNLSAKEREKATKREAIRPVEQVTQRASQRDVEYVGQVLDTYDAANTFPAGSSRQLLSQALQSANTGNPASVGSIAEIISNIQVMEGEEFPSGTATKLSEALATPMREALMLSARSPEGASSLIQLGTGEGPLPGQLTGVPEGTPRQPVTTQRGGTSMEIATPGMVFGNRQAELAPPGLAGPPEPPAIPEQKSALVRGLEALGGTASAAPSAIGSALAPVTQALGAAGSAVGGAATAPVRALAEFNNPPGEAPFPSQGALGQGAGLGELSEDELATARVAARQTEGSPQQRLNAAVQAIQRMRQRLSAIYAPPVEPAPTLPITANPAAQAGELSFLTRRGQARTRGQQIQVNPAAPIGERSFLTRRGQSRFSR